MGATVGTLYTSIFGCTTPAAEEAASACEPTVNQTMGPFHPNKDQQDKDFDLTSFNGSDAQPQGEPIYVRGKVTDENCNPIPGAVVMLWQANTHGKYSHEYDHSSAEYDPNFQGWGQVTTNEKGEYGFKTIKPGAYPLSEGSADYRTPHIHFKFSRRGYHELITQLYFEGEELNETDVLLGGLNAEEKAQVVRPKTTGAEDIEDGASLVTFDVVLENAKDNSTENRLKELSGKYSVDIEPHEMKEELSQFYGGQREELTLTITTENGLLYAEMPIQPKCEVKPIGDNVYAYLAFEADIHFQQDDNGKVTGLQLKRYYEFPTLSAEKIN
ncbi:MAG: intradiol ring-cleavage dioxygenase [Bacteroidetes bacterium]|nr:MAG: intradiol ring-cleavage dioxygenase [Bacteroidota bacterium]